MCKGYAPVINNIPSDEVWGVDPRQVDLLWGNMCSKKGERFGFSVVVIVNDRQTDHCMRIFLDSSYDCALKSLTMAVGGFC